MKWSWRKREKRTPSWSNGGGGGGQFFLVCAFVRKADGRKEQVRQEGGEGEGEGACQAGGGGHAKAPSTVLQSPLASLRCCMLCEAGLVCGGRALPSP